jgi:hypothetical protein
MISVLVQKQKSTVYYYYYYYYIIFINLNKFKISCYIFKSLTFDLKF